MASKLRIDSFHEINIVERGELSSDYVAEATAILLRSTQGFVAGQTIYVGALAREGVEKAVVESVADETTINLTEALKLPHARYDAVTAVLGDQIHVYRAVNVQDAVPDDGSFSVLATRAIDPDQQSTYFADSAGSSGYWYRFTYFDPTTMAETPLTALDAVRGQDFPHYASLGDIRQAAGLQNAFNLADRTVELWRGIAETEINSALAGAYTVPFNPAPAIVKSLTLELAAALLLVDAYGNGAYGARLKDARAKVTAYGDKTAVVTDENGQSLSTSNSVTGYPDANAPRSFYIGQRF
ncbi:hypothetical protein HAV21_03520 [Paenarthrobacter sp. MSM-2-10-13]|uniref:hypothetical protein n=1 Tax=Paenarthrobacter sp. MSM-2-10-13 TaxID=2717318 RepID=UPI0014239DCA|nr:hypothetical protein [Paenarthrobacter sp. MSM-2-10-13]NHW45967.1 hypothetical protein [Paenarthrobacter sp. MSM-2-10-13]